MPRRTLIKCLGLAGAAVATSPALAACGGGSKTQIRLEETKPEVVGYFDKLVAEFNKTHPSIAVTHDSTTSLIAAFVRGRPPDIDCDNYNLVTSIFLARGVLADLADQPAAKLIDPNVQGLVGQYAQYRGETSVLPFSVAAEGVIYNKDHFDAVGADIPKTWSDLLDLCDKFKSRKITPIYGTFKDGWTISQGLFDYVTGGMIDVAAFYKSLSAAGTNIGRGTGVSFTETFTPAVKKMVDLLPFHNADAPSRGYADGNVAFAHGDGAMYLQGPWAIGGIAAANPKLRLGTFPLPSTDNASDTRCRVNLDLAIWLPRQQTPAKRAAALQVLDYLMQPSLINAYNQANLAFSPLKVAPAVTDARVAGLDPYVRGGKFYQGAGTYVPTVIPLNNYLQELVLSKNAGAFTGRLDSDFRRLAVRTAA